MKLQSFDDVRHLTRELEGIARWQEVLLWKFSVPNRRFEPQLLEAELSEFKRECIALAKAYRSNA